MLVQKRLITSLLTLATLLTAASGRLFALNPVDHQQLAVQSAKDPGFTEIGTLPALTRRRQMIKTVPPPSLPRRRKRTVSGTFSYKPLIFLRSYRLEIRQK